MSTTNSLIYGTFAQRGALVKCYWLLQLRSIGFCFSLLTDYDKIKNSVFILYFTSINMGGIFFVSFVLLKNTFIQMKQNRNINVLYVFIIEIRFRKSVHEIAYYYCILSCHNFFIVVVNLKVMLRRYSKLIMKIFFFLLLQL